MAQPATPPTSGSMPVPVPDPDPAAGIFQEPSAAAAQQQQQQQQDQPTSATTEKAAAPLSERLRCLVSGFGPAERSKNESSGRRVKTKAAWDKARASLHKVAGKVGGGEKRLQVANKSAKQQQQPLAVSDAAATGEAGVL